MSASRAHISGSSYTFLRNRCTVKYNVKSQPDNLSDIELLFNMSQQARKDLVDASANISSVSRADQ